MGSERDMRVCLVEMVGDKERVVEHSWEHLAARGGLVLAKECRRCGLHIDLSSPDRRVMTVEER
jgi:hypothetical protein